MTITEDRGNLRVTLRTFIREEVVNPLDGNEEQFQDRIDTEVNALLAGFSSDEDKLVAISNFKAVRGKFVDLVNNNFKNTFGIVSAPKMDSYIKKSLKTARESLVIEQPGV